MIKQISHLQLLIYIVKRRINRLENLDFDDDGYMVCGGCQGEKKIQIGPEPDDWLWCNICRGSGKIDWIEYIKRPPLYECPKCKGRKRIVSTFEHKYLLDDETKHPLVVTRSDLCPTCEGKGHVDWVGCARG